MTLMEIPIVVILSEVYRNSLSCAPCSSVLKNIAEMGAHIFPYHASLWCRHSSESITPGCRLCNRGGPGTFFTVKIEACRIRESRYISLKDHIKYTCGFFSVQNHSGPP